MSGTPNSSQHHDDDRDARIVSEHLPSGYTADFDGSLNGQNEPNPSQEEPESSLNLQGGDIHRDLFKINRQSANLLHKRAATFSHLNARSRSRGGLDDEPTASAHLAPGAFRRQFVQQRHKNFDLNS